MTGDDGGSPPGRSRDSGSTPPSGLTPGRWAEIERVLDAALDAPDDEWPGVLDRLCGDDAALRDEVESLLRRRSEIDGFLEGRVVEPPPAPTGGAAADTPGGGRSDPAGAGRPPRPSAMEGRRVGAYRVVRLVARGGMGEVFLAERADGHFEQRVALKLLPPGRETEGVARRLRAERQILAGLEHPSIARLLDGGVTGEGRPYLVMEYVDGEALDSYCDRHELPVRERLSLFVRVAEAVHHAHRSLVVHRDLKPSNIHVTRDGTIKLLDFGIAKLLQEETGTARPTTRTGRRWMTPEYAAPEQIEGEPVTTATDVYQLGVLLYQLLSGRLPFEAGDGPLYRLERAVLETAPEKPSAAVTRRRDGGDAGAPDGEPGPASPKEIARARSTRPGALRRALRGDLDAIVLRALRKEPGARYGSARSMRQDVERHLEGGPVAARRGTLAYRGRKFLRRHRLGVSAAAALVLLLAGYAATVTVQSGRVRAALEDARTEARKAEQVSAFLVGLFEASAPGEALGDTVTARELLERGVERAGELEGQPEVQATMLDEMGRVYQSLGRFDRAEPLLEKALALRRSVYGERHIEVAKSLDNVATLMQDRGAYDEAETLFRRALAVRRDLSGRPEANVDVGLNNLALLLTRKGEYGEAGRLYRRSLAIKRERHGDGSPEVATALHNLASLLRESGDSESAEALFRRALELRSERLGEGHPLVAQSKDHLGAVLVEEGDHEAAEALLSEALATRREVLGEDHPGVTTTLHNLAALHREKGDLEEAEALAGEVLARDRRQLGDRHPFLAHSLIGLARVHLDRGEAERAEPLLEEALEIREAALPAGHWEVAEAAGLLGECFAALGRHAEAEGLLRESHARLLAVFGPEDRRTRRASARIAAMGRASRTSSPAAGGEAAGPPE